MSDETLHLSERSRQLYAQRRSRQRLQHVRMDYDCNVRAFRRPRRKVPHAGNPPPRDS